MAPLENLVHYVGVAMGSLIIAELVQNKTADLHSLATQCMACLPPFHCRFSYTTMQRRLICLIEDPLIYCAIIDEALSKADGFALLQKVRDASVALVKAHPMDVQSLAPHFLDDGLIPVMQHLASPLIGIPQREIDKSEDFQLNEVGLPANSSDLNLETGDSSFDTRLLCRASEEKEKNKHIAKNELNEMKDVLLGAEGEARDVNRDYEVLVDDINVSSDAPGTTHQSVAKCQWWLNVKRVIILDFLACVVLLLIWLGVCKGTRCLKRSG